VQRFQVQPNELVRETPHIERAVAATREGFSLGSMTRVRLPYRVPDTPDWGRAEERLSRLPVWTPKTLEETFQEVEARFRYYRFAGVSFTRYPDPERPGNPPRWRWASARSCPTPSRIGPGRTCISGSGS
jgi:uncharacterized protein